MTRSGSSLSTTFLVALVGTMMLPSAAAATATIGVNTYLDSQFGGNPVSQAIAISSSNLGFSPQQSLSQTRNGATAFGSVDLVSGTIRGGVDTRGSNEKGAFSASLAERFLFNISGAAPDTQTLIGLRVYFNAQIQGYNQSMFLDTQVNAYSDGQGETTRSGVQFFSLPASSQLNVSYPGTLLRNLPVTQLSASLTAATYDYIHYFTVRGANPIADVNFGAMASISNGGMVDFGNSGHAGLVLPANVSFTSSSGNAFTVSAFPGAVPEPASWLMLIAGFGLTGSILRRQRRAMPGSAIRWSA